MGILSRAAGILTLVLLTFFTSTSLAAAKTEHHAGRSTSVRHVDATGSFQAEVFFDSLRTRNVGESKCEFTLEGRLTFTGTVQGVASGTTTALIDAPCPEATDPANVGAFRDVFRFEGTFTGTVDGVPVTGPLSYAGVTRPGGSIDANIKLRADGAKASLHTVTAQLGVGGTYRGVAVVMV
jgi:hypothetical protein